MRNLIAKPFLRTFPLALSAVLVLAAIAQESPENENLLKEARAQFDDGAYHRAAALYTRILETDPTNREASDGYIDCLLALDEKTALEYLEKTVSGPDGISENALADLAELRLRRGRSDSAAELLNGVNGAEAALVRGKIYLARGEYGPAVKEFKTARIYGLPETEYYLAEALIAAGRYSEAVSYLQSFTSDYPYVAEAHAALGETYQHNGRYETALAEYDKALSLDAACGRALCNRGWLYYVNDDYGAAIRDYNAALIYDPWDPAALYNLALVYEKVDRSVARTKWTQFIEMYNGKPEEKARVEKAKEKLNEI